MHFLGRRRRGLLPPRGTHSGVAATPTSSLPSSPFPRSIPHSCSRRPQSPSHSSPGSTLPRTLSDHFDAPGRLPHSMQGNARTWCGCSEMLTPVAAFVCPWLEGLTDRLSVWHPSTPAPHIFISRSARAPLQDGLCLCQQLPTVFQGNSSSAAHLPPATSLTSRAAFVPAPSPSAPAPPEALPEFLPVWAPPPLQGTESPAIPHGGHAAKHRAPQAWQRPFIAVNVFLLHQRGAKVDRHGRKGGGREG